MLTPAWEEAAVICLADPYTLSIILLMREKLLLTTHLPIRKFSSVDVETKASSSSSVVWTSD